MNLKDKFLMCPPRFYAVEYVINPWMEGNIGRTNPEAAREQWEKLHETLQARAEVELIDPVEGLPDMAFTANSGLVAGKTFIPARFRYAQREPETGHFVRWLESRGLRIAELGSQGTFEGEGDALLQPGEALLWCGYGVRSSLLVCGDLSEILGVEVIPLRLVDERFYHLDTCFCPLPGGKVIYYPEAFDQESVQTIRRRVKPEELFEAGTEDALSFACNAIVTGDAYITNFAGHALRERLARWGYEVILCPLDQFVLAGGSAKCLALGLHAPLPSRPAGISPEIGVCQRTIEIEGQLLDTDLMTDVLDCITEGGCSFEIDQFQAGLRHDQKSRARIRVVAPTAARLETVAGRLIQMGARATESEADARFTLIDKNNLLVTRCDFSDCNDHTASFTVSENYEHYQPEEFGGYILTKEVLSEGSRISAYLEAITEKLTTTLYAGYCVDSE
ncbi:hypothetical protein IIC65_00705 [Candidatus Sumerlaeota bacterium]|nr:hypothetical protein [Candidatus Sumerlaeota bacterium]